MQMSRVAKVTNVVVATFLAVMLVAPGAVVVPAILSQPVQALDSGSTITQRKGFDTMCAPTTDEMNTLWLRSPWWWAGVYVGGVNVACKNNANLNSAWLNTVRSQGWFFAFFWVGEQGPCVDQVLGYAVMSSDLPTAESQGSSNASSAYNQIIGPLGVANSARGTPITFDLEGYGQPASGSACQQAVNRFMRGWTTNLHISPAQLAGVYGSTCGSNLDLLAGVSPVVDYIHGAAWSNSNPDPNPSNMPCVSSGHWTTNQRLKQYQVGQSAGPYGVNITVDYNCARGPVAPSGASSGADC